MGQTVRFIPDRYGRPCRVRTDHKRGHFVKKLEKAGRSEKENPANNGIDLENIILAGVERGLTITDIRRMQLGQVVDFCIEYNNRQMRAEKQQKREEKRGGRRKATQSDINSFFG